MLQGVEGAATAKVVATDALATGAVTLLGAAFPEAEIIDGGRLLDRAPRVKTPEEVDAIGASVAVAERALTATGQGAGHPRRR